MRVVAVRGDITTAVVDAVVNAANSGLLGGGGVDGALLRAGGPEQLAERQRLRERIGRLPTGRAAATGAGRLSARWVIHVVGPVYSPVEDRGALLASCYREALAVADQLGARTVAAPAVSAGAYGWPVADAARIAVASVLDAPTRVDELRFVLADPAAYAAFAAELARSPAAQRRFS